MSKRKTKTVEFSEEGIEALPKDKPVVYRIFDSNGQNIYTGVAQRGNVADRLRDHLPGGHDPIPGGATVRIERKTSIDEARKSEKNIIRRSKPKYNRER